MRMVFNDAQVRAIKTNLVLGVSIATLARQYGVSVETVGKMKRGLTYRHVVVPGEEKLRPEIELVPLTKEQAQVMTGMTEEEEAKAVAASLEELQRRMAVDAAAKGAVGEIEQEAAKKAAGFFGAAVPKGLRGLLDGIPDEPLE